MEIEKAIETLKARKKFIADINFDAHYAYDLAISALEKQVSFKPYDEGYGWQCKCGTPLTMYEYIATKTLNDYCYCCGQKLDWSEVENE